MLSPEQILDQVLPESGTLVIRFVDLLYPGPPSKPARLLFLKEAIKRAGRDPTQTDSERLWCEAQARARFDEHDLARKGMEAALAEEPTREVWRNEYIDWLIRWGDTEEAFAQATIGVNLVPMQSGPHRLSNGQPKPACAIASKRRSIPESMKSTDFNCDLVTLAANLRHDAEFLKKRR